MSGPVPGQINVLTVSFRSLFMWYMWRIENVDVAVLGG